MLVEISDATLEQIRKYKKDGENIKDMSNDEFNTFKILACYVCGNLISDINNAERAVKRSGK